MKKNIPSWLENAIIYQKNLYLTLQSKRKIFFMSIPLLIAIVLFIAIFFQDGYYKSCSEAVMYGLKNEEITLFKRKVNAVKQDVYTVSVKNQTLFMYISENNDLIIADLKTKMVKNNAKYLFSGCTYYFQEKFEEAIHGSEWNFTEDDKIAYILLDSDCSVNSYNGKPANSKLLDVQMEDRTYSLKFLYIVLEE